MRAHLRSLGACTLLMGMSAPAWADEPPDPAVTPPPPATPSPLDARPRVARFDDETKEPHAITHLSSSTDVRTAPDGAGELVAHLPSGTLITLLASRGDAFLVAFDDPEGLSARIFGWVPVDALSLPNQIVTTAPVAAWSAPRPKGTWYGWQTLVVDGAAASLAIAGVFVMLNRDTHEGGAMALYLAATMYAVGAPVTHWAHGNVSAGLGSLGMRLLTVGVVYVVATSVFHGSSEGDAAGTLAIAVPAVDASLWAYDTRGARPAQQVTLNPTVAPTKDGATVGLVGSF